MQNGAAFASGEFQSFSLDGEDDYVDIPSSTDLKVTTEITVLAWVKLSADMRVRVPHAAIVVKGVDAEDAVDWALTVSGTWSGYTGGKLRTHVNVGGAGGWKIATCNTILLPDTWYHVAMNYDGASLKCFVDGQLDGSISVTGAIQTSDGSLRIGSYAPINGTGSKHFFPGFIDEVRFYNRALSAAEILSLAQ